MYQNGCPRMRKEGRPPAFCMSGAGFPQVMLAFCSHPQYNKSIMAVRQT